MKKYQLAQLNIAAMQAPMESPVMADFVNNLDRINAMADNSPGFVWRLKDEEGNATSFRPFGEDTLVNISVWDDLESLRKFVYGAGHVEIMKRRREWFTGMSEAYVVLWWVPAGHLPAEAEAKEKLGQLRANGPTKAAFNFRQPFPEPASL